METKTGRELLESFAKSDDDLLGDPEVDGMAFQVRIWGEVARDMLKTGREWADGTSTINEYNAECTRRWREGKFFQLYQTEGPAGFAARGWEM